MKSLDNRVPRAFQVALVTAVTIFLLFGHFPFDLSANKPFWSRVMDAGHLLLFSALGTMVGVARKKKAGGIRSLDSLR